MTVNAWGLGGLTIPSPVSDPAQPVGNIFHIVSLGVWILQQDSPGKAPSLWAAHA